MVELPSLSGKEMGTGGQQEILPVLKKEQML